MTPKPGTDENIEASQNDWWRNVLLRQAVTPDDRRELNERLLALWSELKNTII